MEHLNEDKARIFDAFYSNDQLTILKIMSFFIDSKQRPMIAVLIKYMELNICIQKSIKNHEIPCCSGKNENPENMEDFLLEIIDYLPKESQEMMEQLKNMKETFDTYSQMMEMMNMMQDTSTSDMSPEDIFNLFHT